MLNGDAISEDESSEHACRVTGVFQASETVIMSSWLIS